MNKPNNKKIRLNFASLNANSIIKNNKKQIQSNYIRYLRSRNFSILCLQESHADSDTKITSLNMQFQSVQAHWTKHLGIMSFSADFQVNLIETQHLYNSNRYQLCQVSHPHNFYDKFYILNLYAPASSTRERREFFHQLSVCWIN